MKIARDEDRILLTSGSPAITVSLLHGGRWFSNFPFLLVYRCYYYCLY